MIREGRANAKLRCALPAIMLGENDRIYLPSMELQASQHDLNKVAGVKAWVDNYMEQLKLFTGTADEHDDMVDVTATAAQLAQQLRTAPGAREADVPHVLVPGWGGEVWGREEF